MHLFCFGFFFGNIYLYKNTVGIFYSNVTAVTPIDSNRNKINPNKICLLHRKLQCESSTKPSCLISINDCKVNFRQIFKKQQLSDILEVRSIRSLSATSWLKNKGVALFWHLCIAVHDILHNNLFQSLIVRRNQFKCIKAFI